jgi:vacuolar-type H+-ATPase subunit E/Vma4
VTLPGVQLPGVQHAALTSAHGEANDVRRAAEERSAELLAAACAEAADIIERRRAAAERLAEHEHRATLAEARAEARAIVLRAQRSVLDRAAAAAQAAVRQVATGTRYGRMLASLEAEARERLSDAGDVQIAGASGGGLVARAGSWEIDLSLDSQVERCLEDLAGELERLWR